MLKESSSALAAELAHIQELAAPLLRAGDVSMLNEGVRKAHDALMAYLDLERTDAEIGALLAAGESTGLRDALIDVNSRLHLNTERALARSYLAGPPNRDPFVGSWINKGFASLLTAQVAAWRRIGVLRGSSAIEKSIIVVGGGALPQTQLSLYQQLKRPIIVVDRDPEAADLCREILARTTLNDLTVVTCAGEDFDYADAGIVVVATLVRDKLKIANQIAKTGPQAVFAPRTPVGLHKLWRNHVDLVQMGAIGWTQQDYCHPQGASVAGLTLRLA